jgi:hypothetical protein
MLVVAPNSFFAWQTSAARNPVTTRTQEKITMSADQKTYTIDQIAVAARELREAGGADPERYTSAEVASLLSGEIEMLRQRGFTDERITGLISAFDIDIKPRQIERRSRAPSNFIRRLLWGRLNRARTQPNQLQPE